MIRLARWCVPAPSLCWLAFGAALPAQALESRGPLAGAAVAIAIDGGLAGGGDAQARVHRNGFQVGAPASVSAAGTLPDLGAILATFGAPAGLDIDDISLGRDDILFNGSGVSSVPVSSWAVMSFSLRAGATGVAGSRIWQEANQGPIGATLFSWIQQGAGLPAQLVNRVERSHSRLELGLTAAAAPQVDSIDFPMALGIDQTTLAASDPTFASLVPATQSIYFTVSHATRGLVPVSWWGGNPATLASGATIFVTERSQTSGPWSQPAVWHHYFELGLGQNEDIDGLAIDTARSRVLFSCTGTARDQFLVLDGISLAAPVPQTAKTSTGTPVSQAVGIGQNDDVAAICTLDPTLTTQGAPPPGGDDFGSSCGTPGPGLLGVPSVGSCAYRRYAAGARFYDTWMIGWPPLTGVTPGIAALFANVGADPTLIPLGIQLRDTTSPIPGNPIPYSLAIPAPYALGGLKITFRWVAIDAGFTELAEAWPVQVWL